MIVMSDQIETKAWVIPYEKGTTGVYVSQPEKNVLVSSVDGEENLVSISVPGGNTVIVKASHIITAIQKCVM